MSRHNVLKLSCSCGAQLIFEEVLSSDHVAHHSYERSAFLEAHEICRTKANSSEVVKRLLKAGEDD